MTDLVDYCYYRQTFLASTVRVFVTLYWRDSQRFGELRFKRNRSMNPLERNQSLPRRLSGKLRQILISVLKAGVTVSGPGPDPPPWL